MRDNRNLQELQQVAPDWIGFIFYEKSPRHVSFKPDMSGISAKKIGVFVDANVSFIKEKIELFKLDGLQFHGSETPSMCAKFRKEGLIIIKSFAIDQHFSFAETTSYESVCDYFIFDTKMGSASGGTGQSFDWSFLQKYVGKIPFILSGGISSDSVADLKVFAHPRWAGIDINSRFEIAPGLKNIKLIQSFRDAVFS